MGLAVLSLSKRCLVFVETLSLMPEEIGHGHVIADVLWSCMDSLWSCLNMNLAIDDCKAKVYYVIRAFIQLAQLRSCTVSSIEDCADSFFWL